MKLERVTAERPPATPAAAWQPLALPRVSRQDAAASRTRCTPRASLPLGPELRLRLCEPDGRACGPHPMRVRLEWGEHALAVHCPAALVGDALRALEPGLDLAALPADLAGLLLEIALIDLVHAWERASGRCVSLTEAAPHAADPGPGLRLLLGTQDGDTLCAVHLACSQAQADAVLATWPVQPRSLLWLPLAAVLRIGATRITHGVLASLRPGDAVLLEDRTALLVVAERWSATAAVAAGRWTLTEAPHPLRDHPEGTQTMAEPHEDGAPAANGDELPVTLTFEVGRLVLEFGEVRRFGPGSVIELPTRQKLVQIAANGRRVGEGELVEVDGALGVRIIRLLDRAERHA